MRRSTRRTRSSRRLASTVIALALAFSGASAALGGTGLVPEPEGLEIGPWWAFGIASGVATASADGMTVTWEGEIPAEFEFAITDDGSATGTWEHSGTGIQRISGSSQGQQVDVIGDLAYSGGGAVTGDNKRLILNGQARTVGTVVVTSSVGSLSMSVDNPSTIPELYLVVRATTCDEAYGEWAYTVEAAFEDEGFSGSFDGFWLGWRETGDVKDHVQELLAAAAMGAELPESPSELLYLVSALLSEYNAFVDTFPNWSVDQVFDLLERTEFLLNELRNLSECDKKLFGEDAVEEYVNGLTFVIQNLIATTAGFDDLPSDAWQHLAQVGARTGAFGAGSTNPELAGQTEQALIAAGERILAANVDPEDGLVFVNADTQRVMATGAAMGWQYQVGDHTYDARSAYEAYTNGSAP